MARYRVRVPVVALRPFDAPAVCVITGSREGIGWHKKDYRHTPWWVFTLILCLPVGVLVSVWLQRVVRVELPVTDAAWRRWKLADSAAPLSLIAALVGGTTALVLGLEGTAPAASAWLGAGSLMVPFVAFLVVRRWKGPRVRRIDDRDIEFVFRNEDAAEAFRRHFVESPPLGGATCRSHEASAGTTCRRCGDFLCAACANPVPHSPLVYCADCLERREAAQRDKPLGYRQRNKPAHASAGFAVLALCFLLLPWFVLGLPLGIWGLVESRRLGEGLWTALAATLINLFAGVMFCVVFLPDYVRMFL